MSLHPFAKSSHPKDPLLGLLQSELTDPGRASARAIDLHANANDASHFLLIPKAVVRPNSVDEVGRLFKLTARTRTPLVFRSGGTSLSGQASTDGVLVDVKRHFQNIEILDSGTKVRVEAGATLRDVNRRLARYGRKLGPDPASEAACTIGGIIANNSSGMSCGTELNTYHTLESLTFVLPSGTVIDTANADASDRLRQLEPELFRGLADLQKRILSNPASRRLITEQFSIKNTMGYGLNSFVDFEDPVQILAHLLVGSEGTLAFIAFAVLRTVPLSPLRASSLLIFNNTTAATDALPDLIDTRAKTLELMDATSLRVGQSAAGVPHQLRDLHIDGHAALLVEYRADDTDEIYACSDDYARLVARMGIKDTGPLSRDTPTIDALWRLRKGLYAQVAGSRPVGTTALLEDIAVPLERLSITCDSLAGLFDRYGYNDSVVFGHAKDGNIHFMLTDRFQGDGLKRYSSFTQDMVDLVLTNGGTLKAEHGTGRVMAPFVRRQFGDELYDVMCEVKRLCDPSGNLNPGVILDDDPEAHLRHIKDAPEIEPEADRCVECGYCEPVCPSRNLTLTPRQRIVVKRSMRRAAVEGDHRLLSALEHEYEYEGLQTCAVDGMCQTACPVGINTGDLVKRLRGETKGKVEQRLWTAAANNWEPLTMAASSILDIAAASPNGLVAAPNRFARSLLGHDALPLWTPDLPQGGAKRTPSRPTGSEPAVAVYLPACIGQMFGAPHGRDSVQRSIETLCQRAGIEMKLPTDVANLCCGTPPASKGYADAAQAMRTRTLASLRAATNNGELPIICDASSCTEALVSMVEQDPEQPRMQVIDALEFAAEVILPNLKPATRLQSLVLHPTCSSTRLGANAHLVKVAEVIAEQVIVPDEWGCCAFAGDRGMLHPELTASATKAEAASARQIDADEFASCNRTCEIGMSRATGKQYVHLLTLLEEVTRPQQPKH